MVAVDEPDLSQIQDGLQFVLQRAPGLHIAEEHNGRRTIPLHDLQHMTEVAVDIAKEIDHAAPVRGGFCCFIAASLAFLERTHGQYSSSIDTARANPI